MVPRCCRARGLATPCQECALADLATRRAVAAKQPAHRPCPRQPARPQFRLGLRALLAPLCHVRNQRIHVHLCGTRL